MHGGLVIRLACQNETSGRAQTLHAAPPFFPLSFLSLFVCYEYIGRALTPCRVCDRPPGFHVWQDTTRSLLGTSREVTSAHRLSFPLARVVRLAGWRILVVPGPRGNHDNGHCNDLFGCLLVTSINRGELGIPSRGGASCDSLSGMTGEARPAKGKVLKVLLLLLLSS